MAKRKTPPTTMKIDLQLTATSETVPTRNPDARQRETTQNREEQKRARKQQNHKSKRDTKEERHTDDATKRHHEKVVVPLWMRLG
jgi:hypothetical protein